MANIRKRLHAQLEQRKEEGTLRRLPSLKGLVDFSSNDYLGIATRPELFQEIAQNHQYEGINSGATGSRLLSGNSQAAQNLEHKLAKIFEGKSALLFNSGYVANLALLATIPKRGDTIIYDSASHACIKDGARLSNAKYYSFRHNDVDDLRKKLEQAEGTPFVAIESLYSMDGDWAALNPILASCSEFQAEVFIDEAHSTGWFGPHGSGWVCAQGLQDQFLARVYTFGKAIGAHGACIVADPLVINYLINYARPFIYTTALPPTALKTIDGAWKIINNQPHLSKGLQENINLYVNLVQEHLGLPTNEGSPIQWLGASGNDQVQELAATLQGYGFDVRPIRAPTVPKGSERLRICIHSFNTPEQIEGLVKSIKEIRS